MKNKEFTDMVSEFFGKSMELLEKKGREYQSNCGGMDEVFANFIRTGADMDISKEKVAYIFLRKHLDSIATYIKDLDDGGGMELTESIEGRIADAVNYLLLLLGMFKEGRV